MRRIVETGLLAAGDHHLSWDGEDESGRAVTGGVYFIRLSTPERNEVARFVLLR